MLNPRPTKVLLIDDDTAVLRSVTELLTRAGHQALILDDPGEALAAAKDPSVEVAVVAVGMNGLAALKEARPDLEVILMSTDGSVESAVEAVKAGAYDCLTKPLENLDEVRLTVEKAAERKFLRDRARTLEEQLSARPPGSEDELAHLPYAQAKRVAMRAFERRYLSSLLEKSNFNISSAARAAGVDRSNFRRLLKQYDVGKGRVTDTDESQPNA